MADKGELLKGAVSFIARQLNDHTSQPHGVKQKTAYSWTEEHIEKSLDVALSYVYTYFPAKFAKIQETVIETESCILDFCGDCARFLNVVWVGDECNSVDTIDPSDNSKIGLFQIPRCTSEGEEDYVVERIENNECSVKVTPSIPAGTTVGYNCADIDNVSEELLDEFKPYIYAATLYWLLRTDNESDSNRELYTEYKNDMDTFLRNKLVLDFSITEDDYNNGIRKIEG